MSLEDLEAVFVDLYRRYYSAIVSYLMKTSGFSREEALDLAQKVFLRVYRSMHLYRRESEWQFLKIVATRVAINERRGENTDRRFHVQVPIDERLDALDGRQTPEVLVAEQEELKNRRRWLRGAIQRLPDSLRKCVILQLSGKKYNTIAEILNISLDAVKSRLNEARKRLREMLAADTEEVDWPAGLGEDEDDQEN